MNVGYVEWLDAREVSGRISINSARLEGPLMLHTAGIIIRADDEVITVAQDYWHYIDDDKVKQETVRDVQVIPRALIKEYKTWDTDTVQSPTTSSEPRIEPTQLSRR